MAKDAIARDYAYRDFYTVTNVHPYYNNRHDYPIDGIRFVYRKSPNTSNPKINGWRKPAAHYMSDLRYTPYLKGTAAYTFNGDTQVRYLRYVDNVPVGSVLAGLDMGPPARLEPQTIMKAVGNMRANAVNLGVAFGERREAASMIRDRAVTMVRAVRELRKGNLRSFRTALGLRPGSARSTRSNARDIAGQVPELWLEHQYGWKPLLSDIHTAVERYADNNYRDPTRLWSSVKATQKSVRTKTRVVGSWLGSEVTCVDRCENRGFVRIDYSPDEYWDHLKGPEEWGLLNPLAVAWELVPFSFVADWFLPVGDWLHAITATLPYKFKDGSYTHFGRATSRATARATNPNPAYGVTNFELSGTGFYSRTWMERKTYTDFPYISMAALAPRVSDASAESIFTRAANALSILATTFRG